MITNIKESSIDKHKSILLVGIGKTNKYFMEIVQPESIDEAEKYFGDSNLTQSYKIMLDVGAEAQNIYIVNIENIRDYLELSQHIYTYDFSYIVPLDIYISEYFYDPTQNGRRTYYLQYLLQHVCKEYQNHSIIIATDAHASLYEDIDAFLEDMQDKNASFKSNKMTNEYFERILFTMNNIKDIEFANAVLAAAITTSDVNEYPSIPDALNLRAIFDIDVTDHIDDLIFFKSHIDNSITIENLLSLYRDTNPIKIFFIYRILLYIAKELDFTKFIGSKYFPYKVQQIQQIVENYLSSIIGYIITDYRINQVYATEDPYHPATVINTLKYEVAPIGCNERFIQQTLQVSA